MTRLPDAKSKLPIRYDLATPHERKAARLAYIEAQAGKCYHCGAPLSGPPHPTVAAIWVSKRLFPSSFFVWPVHLHHCHVSGMTKGAVHNHCNAVLWQYHGE
jgi:hypothetical protein